MQALKTDIQFANKTTSWLKEVLDDDYTRCPDGRDFEERRSEIQEIVWEREEISMGKDQQEREKREAFADSNLDTHIEKNIHIQLKNVLATMPIRQMAETSGINHTTLWRMANQHSDLKMKDITKLEKCGYIDAKTWHADSLIHKLKSLITDKNKEQDCAALDKQAQEYFNFEKEILELNMELETVTAAAKILNKYKGL